MHPTPRRERTAGRPRERVRGPALGHAAGEAAWAPRASEARLAPGPGVPALVREPRTQRGVLGSRDGGQESWRCRESALSWPHTPRRRGPPPCTPGVIAWRTELSSAVGALPGRLRACLPPAAGRRSGQQAPRSREPRLPSCVRHRAAVSLRKPGKRVLALRDAHARLGCHSAYTLRGPSRLGSGSVGPEGKCVPCEREEPAEAAGLPGPALRPAACWHCALGRSLPVVTRSPALLTGIVLNWRSF